MHEQRTQDFPNPTPKKSSKNAALVRWEFPPDDEVPRYEKLFGHLLGELDGMAPGSKFFTIREIIKRSGFSLPTVRHALGILVRDGYLAPRRGSGFFVLARPGQHNFDPKNANASPTDGELLVVMPSYTTPDDGFFTARIIAGMTHEAGQHRCRLRFLSLRSSLSNPVQDFEEIAHFGRAGIVWLHLAHNPATLVALTRLRDRNIPIVSTMRGVPGLGIACIHEDVCGWAESIVEAFANRGHENLALLTGSLSDPYYAARVDALRTAAEKHRLSIPPQRVIESGQLWTREENTALLAEFLRRDAGLTAFVCIQSSEIESVAELFESRNHPDPAWQKLSILLNRLDGVPLESLPDGRRIATITPPLEEIGRRLVQVLVGSTRDDSPIRLLAELDPADTLGPAS